MQTTEFPKMLIPSGEACRILQLTDLHTDVDEAANARTWREIALLVDRLKPHLLTVTGDIWCSDDAPEAGPARMQRDIDLIDGLGIPWAFCWGNHDYCPSALEAGMAQLAAARHSLVPVQNHHGAYRIELGVEGAREPAWDLFFLHSGPRWTLPRDLDWFVETSRDLAQVRGRTLPAMAWFHIPLRNYQEALDGHRQVGEGEEEVLCWGDEAGLGAGMLKAPGNLAACFCGHSHKNDFYFAEGGIIFAYGRATGYGGYGGEDLKKGATFVQLDMSEPVFRFRTAFAAGGDGPERNFIQAEALFP